MYSFMYSMRMNKITLQRAEELIFMHSNMCLDLYLKGESKRRTLVLDCSRLLICH